MLPEISVIIPARNESSHLAETVATIAASRTTAAPVEIVIVDDASTDACAVQMKRLLQDTGPARAVTIRVCRLDKRAGVPWTRNLGADRAHGDVLVMTDAHVRFPAGWDRVVLQHLRPGQILAGGIVDDLSGFHGYGCRLSIPSMGTLWNRSPVGHLAPVQIASCSATALHRDLFRSLGGYDPGMLIYGGAEPEFSVRAWLHGAEVLFVPDLVVSHRFKTLSERASFVAQAGTFMVHNSIRFGLLYLSELGALQLLRYYARRFPDLIQRALRLIQESDVWMRKMVLERQRRQPFEWMVQRFGITDEAGRAVL